MREMDPTAAAVVKRRMAMPAGDLPTKRQRYADAGRLFGTPIPEDLRIEEIPVAAATVRTYRPAQVTHDGCLLWVHGGGWISGSARGFDHTAAALAVAGECLVVSVEYALAPERPYPAACIDVTAAFDWVRSTGAERLGYSSHKVVIGGDSAGGNLVCSALTRARQSSPKALGQVLVYPVVDRRMTRDSYQMRTSPLTREAMEVCWEAYLGSAVRPIDGDFSPIDADLGGRPPTLLVAAGHDVLRDDVVAYADALRSAGTVVSFHEFEDMPHGFLEWSGCVTRAAELVALIGGFVRERMSS